MTIFKHGNLFGLFMVFLFFGTASSQTKSPSLTSIRGEFSQDTGKVMPLARDEPSEIVSEPEAQALEKKLKAEPNDLTVRTSLVEYYADRLQLKEMNENFDISKMKQEDLAKKIKEMMVQADQIMLREKGSKERLKTHIYWFISHYPNHNYSTQPLKLTFELYHDNDFWYEATGRWNRNLKKYPKNTDVLDSAAMFFEPKEYDRSEELLKKAEKLQPKNPKWPLQLSFLYLKPTGKKSVYKAIGRTSKEEALNSFKSWLKITSLELQSYYYPIIAALAFDLDQTEYAKKLAEKMLENKSPDDLLRLEEIHYGNTILGRISLKNGDTAKAKEYLLKSADIGALKFEGCWKRPESNHWDIRYPTISLARDLLEKKEGEIVVKYFETLGPFWPGEKAKDLRDKYIAIAKEGNAQKFKINWGIDNFGI